MDIDQEHEAGARRAPSGSDCPGFMGLLMPAAPMPKYPRMALS
jgi:hypothetical protein